MHELEPFYNWRHLYTAEDDELSPFYGKEYSEFEFTNTVYNYYIHPQWDEFGAKNLYLKMLYADYEYNFVIVEMIGEWNDAIEDDIMQLKRSFIDHLFSKEIFKFIFITENVLNFHSGDVDYYQEWKDDIKEKGGWMVALNMPQQTQYDFQLAHIDRYLNLMEIEQWRTMQPFHLFQLIDNKMISSIE